MKRLIKIWTAARINGKSQGKPRYDSVISWAVTACLGYTVTPFQSPSEYGLYFPFPSRLCSSSYIRLFDSPRLFGESMTCKFRVCSALP